MTNTSPPIQTPQRLKADLLLLLVAVIWGSAFVAQRVAAQNMDVYLFNGLRFLLGALVLVVFQALQRRTVRLPDRRDIPAVALAGILLFAGTTFQQLGLRHTTAANAGFITGLYVVIIPIVLALFLRQTPRRVVWLAAVMATVGLFLLSTGGSFALARGDGWELVGAFMWALHVILIGLLVQRVDITPLAIIQYIVCGLLSLAASLAISSPLAGISPLAMWAIVYTGVFSVGLGYTLQAVAQKSAPAADAGIILSSEAVFAAAAGWLVLNERLAGIQLLGCGLLLTGMILTQVLPGSRGSA